jgi:flagellar hook protein FlgE
MMRSFFSAITGLKNHKLMMDVVGNNIANVNTTGFKESRATFQDLLYQTLRPATSPTSTLGGQNPSQVGNGSKLATIDTIATQGALQSTGRMTDLAIQGNGYFVLSDNAASNPMYFFTRDGNMSLGSAANATDPRPLIHSPSGMHVKGWLPPQSAGTADSTTAPTTDITIPTTSNSVQVVGFDIDANGIVSLQLADGTTTANYAQLAMSTFANPEGLTHSGSTMFTSSGNSGQPSYNGANVNGRGQINAGFLEMSNVDLATEFTNMIIAQRGFQGNSRVITAADEMLQDLVNIKR